VKPDLVPERALTVIRRHPYLYRAARTARFTVGRFVPPRTYPGIPGRIHFNDFMFGNGSPEEIASYAERALNVISNIDASLAAAGKTVDEIVRWLDFGCGYGRVIRFLAERVPPDRIYASDVVKEGVDFCSSEFGVHPIYSQGDLTTLRLRPFDFIYAISVITHLNERNSAAMLRVLGESLAPGGIALFTTHGQWSLENPETYGAEYEERSEEIRRAVEANGIAFLRYPFVSGDDYGMTWHSREYIETKMEELHEGRMRPLMFKPRGLDGHQDVFAFQRIDETL
jgi:SAM-dependent methyltransferase